MLFMTPPPPSNKLSSDLARYCEKWHVPVKGKCVMPTYLVGGGGGRKDPISVNAISDLNCPAV